MQIIDLNLKIKEYKLRCALILIFEIKLVNDKFKRYSTCISFRGWDKNDNNKILSEEAKWFVEKQGYTKLMWRKLRAKLKQNLS